MTISRFVTISDLDLAGKRVLVRVDFNVPVKDGKVEDDTRIRASLPTIQQLLDANAGVMLISHLGRPQEGERDQRFSLAPVANALTALLNTKVPLVDNWLDGVALEAGQVLLLENVRFENGEKANDDNLARKMAGLCDVYVNDAFATAHRAQASTHGVTKYAPVSCIGPLLLAEIEALSKALKEPARPMVAIVGGSKISTKLTVLESLLEEVDQLIVGGGIANTFLQANGDAIGNSLNEPDLIPVAEALMAKAQALGKSIPLPVDVVCGKAFDANTPAEKKTVAEIEADDLIMDVGPETVKHYSELLTKAKTIVWNGPLGVFEFESFANGTRELAQAIAKSPAYSIAGGGDTLSAIAKFGVTENISYISTGGGAFLEFMEGKKLPAITILEESARAWYAMERAREY